MGTRDTQPPSQEGSEALDCSATIEVHERLTRLSFPPSHRLTDKAGLTSVMREGKRVRTQHLDVRAKASPFVHPRVGIIVPKRQRTTVDRNLVKRRLRELCRTELLPLEISADIVIRARPEAYEASFSALRDDVRSAATQILRKFSPLS